MLTPEQARDLVEWAGSRKAAARLTGIPRTTIAHWLDPETGRERAARYYEANREALLAYSRERYWNLSGPEYNRSLLQKRRVKALRRMKQREEATQSGSLSE